MTEAGIQDWSVIEAALSELRQQPGPFLPSTGDFVALCRRVQLSEWRIPSEAEAFQQLHQFMGPRGVVRDFTKLNPAVYAAYRNLDWATVSQLSLREQRRAFREAWARVQEDIQQGRQLPRATAPVALEEQPPQPCSTEHAEKQLAGLKDLVADL